MKTMTPNAEPTTPTVLGTADLDTPIGRLRLVADGSTLVCISFPGSHQRERQRLGRRFGAVRLEPDPELGGLTARLRAYFEGDLDIIDDMPTDPGGTPFQAEVWTALRRIPRGTTTSYGEIAAEIGRPSAVRAVGMANGDNPIPVVIPCHRVIGRNGRLTGYGGGLPRKEWLLRHEGALLL